MIISLYTYISNQPRNPIFIAQNYSTVPITIVSAQLSTLNFCIFLLQIGWLKHPMVQRIYAPKKKLQNFPKLFRVMLFEYSRNLSPTSASKFASLGNQQILVHRKPPILPNFAYPFFMVQKSPRTAFFGSQKLYVLVHGFFRLLKRLIQEE